MSARTEKLLEQINRLRKHVKDLEEAGEDSLSLQKEIITLTRQLEEANNVLNESKIIKG